MNGLRVLIPATAAPVLVLGLAVACAELNVTAVDVAGVDVVPDTATVVVGGTRQLSVRLTDARGNTLTGRAVVWATSDPDLAHVEDTGMIRGLAPGTVTVTATSGSARGTAGVLVVLPAVISVQPDRVRLTSEERAPTPTTAAVTISSGGGGGTLTDLRATIGYAPGQPTSWLTAALDGTASPAQLSLTATSGSLPAGDYLATVTVTSSSPGSQARDVPVELLVVTPAPRIELDSPSVSLHAIQGDDAAQSRAVVVTNGGGGALTGLVASVIHPPGQPAGWLSASLDATTAPSTLLLTASTGALVAGSYDASVLIASAVAGNSPRNVLVMVTVAAPPPSISLSDTARVFTVVVGAPDPAGHAILVSNAGGDVLSGLATTVHYAAGQPSGWLTATLSSTTAPATISLQVTRGMLAAGTYEAQVEVSSSVAGNSPRRITVSLQVLAATNPPRITISPDTATFVATAGGADPAARTLTLSNAGGGTLDGLSTVVVYGAGQPSGWLAASLSGTTAPATLTLRATTGSLPEGTYGATVEVHSSGATNTPQKAAVTFSVDPLVAPAAPTNLSAAEQGRTRIELTWTDNSHNEDSFIVQRSTTAGLTWGFSITLPPNTTQYLDTGLQRNTRYWYRVLACNAAGCTNSATVSERTAN